jgi:hypothetical protein
MPGARNPGPSDSQAGAAGQPRLSAGKRHPAEASPIGFRHAKARSCPGGPRQDPLRSALLDLDDFAACVVAAAGADAVWRRLLAAVWAHNQGRRLERVVSAPAITTALGMLSLWKWRHDPSPRPFRAAPAARAGTRIIPRAPREGQAGWRFRLRGYPSRGRRPSACGLPALCRGHTWAGVPGGLPGARLGLMPSAGGLPGLGGIVPVVHHSLLHLRCAVPSCEICRGLSLGTEGFAASVRRLLSPCRVSTLRRGA